MCYLCLSRKKEGIVQKKMLEEGKEREKEREERGERGEERKRRKGKRRSE